MSARVRRYLGLLSLDQYSGFYGPAKIIWSISQNCREMTISKATFAPSKPCAIHFGCMDSGPNDSTRVKGSCRKGCCRKGSCGKGSCGQGSCGKGSCGKGSCGKGSCGKGSCGKGSRGKGSYGKGSCGKGLSTAMAAELAWARLMAARGSCLLEKCSPTCRLRVLGHGARQGKRSSEVAAPATPTTTITATATGTVSNRHGAGTKLSVEAIVLHLDSRDLTSTKFSRPARQHTPRY
jgi:hypothetical protein